MQVWEREYLSGGTSLYVLEHRQLESPQQLLAISIGAAWIKQPLCVLWLLINLYDWESNEDHNAIQTFSAEDTIPESQSQADVPHAHMLAHFLITGS